MSQTSCSRKNQQLKDYKNTHTHTYTRTHININTHTNTNTQKTVKNKTAKTTKKTTEIKAFLGLIATGIHFRRLSRF